MSSSSVVSVVPKIELWPGEEFKATNKDVTYLDPQHQQTAGVLCVTNFRLLFLSANEQLVVDLPLGLVHRVDKVGGQTTRGDNAYGLDVLTKDVRNFRFAYPQEGHARRGVHDALQTYAFPSTIFALEKFKASPGDIPLPSPPSSSSSGSLPLPTPSSSSSSSSPLSSPQYWTAYSPTSEFQRMGLPNEDWIVSSVNSKYEVCTSYPSLLAVPSNMTDEQLRRVGHFRSRGRIPALTWIHPTNKATITRCSQPRVGFQGKRCAEDEILVRSILEKTPKATKLYILDARPRRNAVANQAKGMGFENEAVYSYAEISFLNIHNIHVMRDSLKKLKDICFPMIDDATWLASLDNTGWLRHIKTILAGAVLVAEHITRGSPVLIHCSDGWDRTAQLASLSQIILDPFYRTMLGFEILIEKEWLAFGHKFAQRIGHCDKNHSDEERSPVFVQFMDCVWQIMQQHPCEFEFNDDFLIAIIDSMFSCLYGNFLFNSEFERMQASVPQKTFSLWPELKKNAHKYENPLFAPSSQPLSIATSHRFMNLWLKYHVRWNTAVARPQEQIYDRVRELKQQLKSVEDQCAKLEQGDA